MPPEPLEHTALRPETTAWGAPELEPSAMWGGRGAVRVGRHQPRAPGPAPAQRSARESAGPNSGGRKRSLLLPLVRTCSMTVPSSLREHQRVMRACLESIARRRAAGTRDCRLQVSDCRFGDCRFEGSTQPRCPRSCPAGGGKRWKRSFLCRCPEVRSQPCERRLRFRP